MRLYGPRLPSAADDLFCRRIAGQGKLGAPLTIAPRPGQCYTGENDNSRSIQSPAGLF